MIDVKNQLFASQEATRQYVVLAQNDLLRSGVSTTGALMDSVSNVADSLRLQLNLGDAMTDAERVLRQTTRCVARLRSTSFSRATSG